MKRRIISEQATGLDKYFYPGCFTAGDADTDDSKAAKVTITINGVRTPAIKKKSTTKQKFVYYVDGGKAYTIENGVMSYIGDWSCTAAQATAPANPAVNYFNKLGLDLTLPDSIEEINDAVREISMAIKNGGTGKDARKFISYVKELKKDPTYASKVQAVTESPDGPVATNFQNLMGRVWTMSDPLDTEMPRFTKKSIKVGNGTFTYYTWNAGTTTTKQATAYNAQECYQMLTDYIDRVDRGEISNIDQLGSEKQTLFKCYNPFWYNGVLNDENRTGTRKLDIKGKERKYLEALLPQLMQDRGETGVKMGTGNQGSTTLQYESLESRLRNALLEAVELKKKRSIRRKY